MEQEDANEPTNDELMVYESDDDEFVDHENIIDDMDTDYPLDDTQDYITLLKNLANRLIATEKKTKKHRNII